MFRLPDGWSVFFQDFASGLPNQIASAYLEDFYDWAVDNAQELIYILDIGERFAITFGDLSLEFYSATTPVPWTLMSAFASHLRRMTSRGFVGKFEAVLFHPADGFVITVALRIAKFVREQAH